MWTCNDCGLCITVKGLAHSRGLLAKGSSIRGVSTPRLQHFQRKEAVIGNAPDPDKRSRERGETLMGPASDLVKHDTERPSRGAHAAIAEMSED